MNITLSVSKKDIKDSQEVLDSLSIEELTHKFIRFLSAERRLDEWRNERYSPKARSLVDQARKEEKIEKESRDFNQDEVRKRFSDTCDTIAQKRNHD